jgi:hypothetical protein
MITNRADKADRHDALTLLTWYRLSLYSSSGLRPNATLVNEFFPKYILQRDHLITLRGQYEQHHYKTHLLSRQSRLMSAK